MNKILSFMILALLTGSFSGCNSVTDSEKEKHLRLWYTAPAIQWKESLPIGNGRLGTMISGNIYSDTLVLNEETIWTGGIRDYSNHEAYAHLDKVRELIMNGETDEALSIGDQYMIGNPRRQQIYQPLGELIFTHNHQGEVSDYKRTLSLDSAMVTVEYYCNGYNYKREYFASNPDDVIVMRYSTNNPEGLDLSCRHTSKQITRSKFDIDKIILTGDVKEVRGIQSDISFESHLQILNKSGFIRGIDDGFTAKGMNEILLAYTASSNFISYNDISGNPGEICYEILKKVQNKDYNLLKESHVSDYTELFQRLSINLGDEKDPSIPTDKLLENIKMGAREPFIDELFYQLGRYLTISGSRKGGQPMNLQGIWNNKMSPGWGSKWTLNINLPMNYWLTEASNLSECHEPLFTLIDDLGHTGEKVARIHYRSRGFMVHHNTDLWRGAAPVDGANWGLWPYGGAWLTRHIWEHYQYTGDKVFLRKYYPLLKKASVFFFDFLSKGQEEFLVASPSISFEQPYYLPGSDKVRRLCEGETMGNQILRDLFTNCLQAAEILEDDLVFRDSLILMRSKLRPTTIDAESGELMEWAWPARAELGKGQLAPLWGVNPGCEINPLESPELAEAALKTIRAREPFITDRLSSGSWVSGTHTNFYARLGEGDNAYETYQRLLRENVFPNLLTSFVQHKRFQIDGNLGVAAGFNEMIMQSHRTDENGNHIIDLLAALPEAWPTGYIKGIRARGGFELELDWIEGDLKTVKITSLTGNTCVLKYKSRVRTISLEEGSTDTWHL